MNLLDAFGWLVATDPVLLSLVTFALIVAAAVAVVAVRTPRQHGGWKKATDD